MPALSAIISGTSSDGVVLSVYGVLMVEGRAENLSFTATVPIGSTAAEVTRAVRDAALAEAALAGYEVLPEDLKTAFGGAATF